MGLFGEKPNQELVAKRKENLNLYHTIRLGSLVEINASVPLMAGARLFVIRQDRNSENEPEYCLSANSRVAQAVYIRALRNEMAASQAIIRSVDRRTAVRLTGEHLTVIKPPVNSLTPGDPNGTT